MTTLVDDTKTIQRAVGVTADGAYGRVTAAAIIANLQGAIARADNAGELANAAEAKSPPFAPKGPTPAEFIKGYIETHEGGMSVDPVDTGNWFRGKLVGSKYGVTGATLAMFRGVSDITQAQMRALTLDEAVQVGVRLYYDAPNFDLLPWNQATASVTDMAWGAGPGQAIKLMQRMIGANDDGRIGPMTAAAWLDYLANHGLEKTARDYGAVRNAFYDQIIRVRPANRRYERGWKSRSASFLPGTVWWRTWG